MKDLLICGPGSVFNFERDYSFMHDVDANAILAKLILADRAE